MKKRSARISAAIAALFLSGSVVNAQTLIWDANGTSDPLGADGNGGWDLGSPNWVSGDTTSGTNVMWMNPTSATSATSAMLGNLTTAAVSPYNYYSVELSDPIVVQDIIFGTASDGKLYNIDDFNGGSLTLNGNVIKATAAGTLAITLGSSSLTLGTGDHVFALADTPGNLPELSINGQVSGTGNVVLDNGSGFQSWGTLVFNADNNFTGSTTISKGRLVITTGGGLSSNSTGVTIGDDGTLSIGGPSASAGSVTINQPITISRGDYSSDGDHTNYPFAFVSENSADASLVRTMNGVITINSTDARIAANTSTLVITQPFVEGTGVTAGTSVVSFTGDTAGYVQLTGDNSAYPGSYQILSNVEVQPANQNAIGGPNSKISFTGGGVLRPPTDMPTFGTHVINYDSFNGGLDIPTGQTFTLDQAITGGSGLGERGAGTLNINAPITGTGAIFWDGVTANQGGATPAVGGIINVNAAVTVGALRLRSPIVNIGNGGSITTTNAFDSFGADTKGSNGNPDNAVINLFGNGKLIQTSNSDFNISDNASTKGTINISDSASLTTLGITFLAKGAGAVGRINQSGGTVTINRGSPTSPDPNGTNFGLVLGDGRSNQGPTGIYVMSGGTLNDAGGEMYVGEGSNGGVPGLGFFTMSAGTVNLGNWFVVGRERAVGTVDISGGIFNHTTRGDMSLGDSNAANGAMDTIKVHGTAVINDNVGNFYVATNGATAEFDLYENAKITVSSELWFGNGGGSTAAANVLDNATLTIPNWFVVGRGGATGTLTVGGHAVITRTNANGGSNNYVGESGNTASSLTIQDFGQVIIHGGQYWISNGGATKAVMTVKNNGSFLIDSADFWVGNGGSTTATLNIQDNATFTTNSWLAVGRGGTANGTINLSGGTLKSNATYTLAGGGQAFTIGGVGSTSTGAVIQTGGILTSNGTFVGESATGSYSISGGSATFNNATLVGAGNGGKGTFTVGGTGNVTIGAAIRIGQTAGATGIVNLNGGTVTTPQITGGASTLNKILNFNGGKVVSSADSTTFITNLTAVNISDGGATIDTNGHNDTITQGLVGTGSGGLNKLGVGNLTIAGNSSYTGATTLAAGNLRLNGSGAAVPILSNGGVNVAGDSEIVFDYTGQSSQIAAIGNLLKASAATGFTSGQFRSSIVANDATHLTSLGYGDGGELGLTLSGSAIPSAVVVKYTYVGDSSLDGRVDLGNDFNLFVQGFLNGGSSWEFGDYNYDGHVDTSDFAMYVDGFKQQGGSLGDLDSLIENSGLLSVSQKAALVSATPEPGSVTLIGIAALAGLGRRRRR